MNRAWVLGAGLAVALVGCKGKQTVEQVRSQVGEDPAAERDLYATVGQKTAVGNSDPVAITGVGLVYKLAGTGSSAPAGGWRAMLENNLKKQGFRNIRELLDDPGKTTSLVLVTALIPPGARKGDPIDVQIGVPGDSRTTSLKGGILLPCDLLNSDTMNNVRSAAADASRKPGADGLLMGSVMAKASGPVVAGTIVTEASARAAAAVDAAADAAEPDPEGADRPTLRAGRIWDGAHALLARPYYLLLNPDAPQTVRMAMQVAERINASFPASGEAGQRVAEAKSKELVLVGVPPAYRHNHYRFLLVARQVPLRPVAADSPYRRKLEDELTEPATALAAALKLEALGSDSRKALRVGLEGPSPWVRFASAEALAYLGHTEGAAELARLAEAHPALRAHCLKALASVDDAAGTDRLVDAMAAADPELRFGAFLALRLADPQHPAVRGQALSHSLKLHALAPGSGGMVHLTTDGRGEVLVFGDGVAFRGPFALPAGSDFTVSVPAGEATATVARVVRVNGEPEVKSAVCKGDVADVLAAIAQLGGGHTEAVELLRRADRAGALTAPLVLDAIPRQYGIERMVALAKADPTLYRADREVAKVGALAPDAEAGNDPLAEPEAKPEAKAEVPRRLSREQGRLFAPRRAPEAEDADPLPLPAPSPAEESTERGNPGRLFEARKKPAEEE